MTDKEKAKAYDEAIKRAKSYGNPWKFWQPRDIRTAKEIIKKWKVIENGNAHDALEDALTELSELKLNLI